ncbi:MAG: Hsp20/alpha crystallin family protein [Synergistaceae bacterium]|nr:Hsp20/alpha crystallin family protein [Synergistaceae bacterium]
MVGLVPFNKRNREIATKTGLEDFYNVLDDFFSSDWPIRRTLAYDTFKVDVQDKGNEYLIEAELPGVNRDDIKLNLDEDKLTIAVTKDESTEDKDKNYIHRERHSLSMSRSILLTGANASGIKAKLCDGLLKITVPKEEKINTAIDIEVE